MKKILFIDRDGTLIQEPDKEIPQVDSLEEMVFLPWVISSLNMFIKKWYKLIIVTNQDWLWTELNPRENYTNINNKMFEIFAWEGVTFSHIFECPHFESDNCKCRKPKVWILWDFLSENDIDYKNSYMVWDRDTDSEFAKNIWVWFYKVIYWDDKHNWWNILEFVAG